MKTKYFRKFKKFNFDEINKKSFEILIDRKIFVKDESSSLYHEDDESFITDDTILPFHNCYIYNRSVYEINKEVYDEMIYVKNWKLKAFYTVEVITDEIELLIASTFQLEDKLIILENNFKKYFNEILDKQYYPLFKDGISIRGYESWEQYFICEMEDNEDHECVCKFLKGEDKFINSNIENQWNDYFVFAEISDYCKTKKNTLLNINENAMETKKTNIDLSFQICLLEEIINLKNWNDITATKKGEILTSLLDKNKDNIKKVYLNFNKKTSEISDKILKDRTAASELMKKILG